MDWDDLRFLLALKREGTLVGAARVLKVDHSTVSRRLASLEESLETSLVTRTPEGLVFTAAGDSAADAAERVETTCSALERGVLGKDERLEGTVKLTTTDTLVRFLGEGFAALHELFPAIRIEVIATNVALDILRGEADLAVRMFRVTQPDLLCRKLGEIGWSLFASDDYVARRGAVSLETLGAHDVVGFEHSLSNTPGGKWLEAHTAPGQVVLRGNSPRSIAAAVAAGLGVSVLPCLLAGGEPRLRRVTPGVLAVTEVFGVIRPDSKHVARIRVTMEHLVALFRKEARLLAGDVPHTT